MAETASEKEKIARIDTLLQLCKKAGQLVFGMQATERLVARKNVKIVVYTSDLAENTKEKLIKGCEMQKIPAYCYGSKEKLGILFGRRATGIISIRDANFASGIKKLLNGMKSKESMEV